MAQLNEIRVGQEIGKQPSHKFIWQACIGCGKERWVALFNGQPVSLRCPCCNCRNIHLGKRGQESTNWKGGKHENGHGYILVRLSPDDFFFPMAAKSGYILEHRLVVAKALGRCLLPWEIVHHKGTKYPLGSIENKSDNRYPENLELLPAKKYHLVDALTKSLIANLQKRVTLLEAENVLLKQQIEELTETRERRN